jgi:hypothetical protein
MRAREWEKRDRGRFMRDQMEALAWVLLASPILVVAFGGGRYSIGEAAVLPVVGLLMLLWFKRRPAIPEHVASVELVGPDDYDGFDARTTPFYLPWCDCGWHGDDQPDEQSARAEALRHTQHVRPGLHAFDG